MVVNRKELEKLKLEDPLSVLLKQMKSDIRDLMITGIDVQIDENTRETFEVTISTTVADNLGK